MKRFLLFLHWLNVDTALGAVITSHFISINLNSSIPVIAHITLLLAVLSIYNFDHLMDARRISSVAKSARHRFYQEHLRALSIYQLFLMVDLMTILWYLPSGILRAGLVLALITGVYFILLFFLFPKKFILKEGMISLVYSMALFLAPVYVKQQYTPDILTFLLWLEILSLAVSNTLIFAWYDHEQDTLEGHTSLSASMGKKAVKIIILINLSLLPILAGFLIAGSADVFSQLIILLMGLIF